MTTNPYPLLKAIYPPEPHETAAWEDALARALQAESDEAIARVIAATAGDDDACDTVAGAIARIAYRHRKATHFAELMLIPVLMPGTGAGVSPAPLVSPPGSLENWLDFEAALREWMPAHAELLVFEQTLAQEVLAVWSPTVIRRHLHRAIPGYEVGPVSAVVAPLELPPGAPRLGFIRFVATSREGWLTLPRPHRERDERLRQRCAFALHGVHDGPWTVDTPERPRFAIPRGIALWLRALAHTTGIRRWMSILRPDPDQVLIALKLGDEPSAWMSFALRRHQIGNRGVATVLDTLAELAPAADAPDASNLHSIRH